MGRDFEVLSSLRLIIYLKLGVFVSRILSSTTQYYNPYTVHGNIELNRSFLCNCFLLSREGSSIITFTYLYNQPSRCMRQVHRGARRTACVTVKNRESYDQNSSNAPFLCPIGSFEQGGKGQVFLWRKKTLMVLELILSIYYLFYNLSGPTPIA